MENIDYLQELKHYFIRRDIYDYVAAVLENPKFKIWSGSGKETHHHYGDGGLLRHTYEVFHYCLDICARHNSSSSSIANRLNADELCISAIWHDCGKIWDYQKIDGVWGKYNNHARRIHHISRSAIAWETNVVMMTQTHHNVSIDAITHNILAHHGQREYGSPVYPATQEAWVLHLADNLSARLDDCNKYDKF